MRIPLLLLLMASCVPVCARDLRTPGGTRDRISINREWKFRLGDTTGAETEFYDDKGWSDVNLPHNFSIPYFRSTHWYTGYGWYRKHFVVPAVWRAKRIFIEFAGAFRDAQVFVNGRQVGVHRGGYTGFSLDITGEVKTGENVLAVRLNNNWNPRLAPRNGDHNFTGGIYRDVCLVITNQVHVAWYGTYVTTPVCSQASGVVNIKTEVRNDDGRSAGYTLRTDIVDPAGRIVTSVSSRQVIPSASTVVFDQTAPVVREPMLWHPRHPFMYKALTRILEGKDTVDRYETLFGFRWMKWTAGEGFFLNGEHYYFRGADVHQDHAGWASAVTHAGILRDVRMIKDCGMDFIRGSHYPHDPSFSDACDSLGILLWEENDFWGSGGSQEESANWFEGNGAYPMHKDDQPYFDESVKTDLREMIRIHRNHPSIIVWSMCNEPFFTDSSTMPRVREFLKELTALTHDLDPTRMVGIGGCQRGDIDRLGDIAGYNGDGARLFLNPGIPSVVTEYGSTIAKRPGPFIPGWGDLQQEKFAWRSGEALWCGFDYGTRAGDFGLMGMVDYFRLPKNMWYWYRSAYRHIAPPEPAAEGIPSRLRLVVDKTVIPNTDGTDDVQVIVSVLGKDGRQLSSSPDVTLQIVSGPGEFPTGSSITFSDTSDISIRDGKAAIEFRSYFGGKTVIKAASTGLQSDSITIETEGAPVYVEGVTPKVVDRPYADYSVPGEPTGVGTGANIAYQKPTRASSEREGHAANRANDGDTTTLWQGTPDDREKWWQVDLENFYTISDVRIVFPSGDAGPWRIEVSKDNHTWEPISVQDASGSNGRSRMHHADRTIAGRFLRITFAGPGSAPASLCEVEVWGRPEN